MEVWVRSQNKEKLYLVKDVQFDKYKKGFFERNKTLKEIAESEDACFVCCNGDVFGEYPTKERCLEIIDEIQKLLCQTLMVVRNLENKPTLEIENIDQSVVVYEMPKE